MKKVIKMNFPQLYIFLKKIYHSTFHYKNLLRKIDSVRTERNRLAAGEAEIMKDVFMGKYNIFNGPFKGMKYLRSSPESMFLPKIMGSYEEPIHDWIDEVIKKNKYKTILNIGCAEGYYAVGLAFRMPQVQVVAYDISEIARQYAEELKCANNAMNVLIKGECTQNELNKMCAKDVLVICDIEGSEIILLDPANVVNLKYVDLIIESHDFLVKNVTDILINRFYKTHKIRIVLDYPFRLKNYNTPVHCSIDQYKCIVDERRPEKMRFIYMESIIG